MEHLRRPGVGRRQLAAGFVQVPRAAGRKILPLCRYFAYVQVADEDQNLWEEYTRVRDANVNFAMQKIVTPAQIFPVFRTCSRRTPSGRPHDGSRGFLTGPPTTQVRGANAPAQPSSDWTFELIEPTSRHPQDGRALRLDTYPTQLEVITAEQMLDAYASVGMPVNYRHWSYGKQFISSEKNYRRGHMGLAYEIVINSDPCIAYLMEENTMPMQALVMAHACFGHNSFFKGNYLFRMWTDASSIIDYLVYAKSYIAECEERHGIDAVEEVLDACHALMNYGVDRYRRPQKISDGRGREPPQGPRGLPAAAGQRPVAHAAAARPARQAKKERRRFPEEPQENLLYFIEKNAPLLEPWQREIVRIVRKVAQYFYPQRQTQVMNEGWATFWHYTLLNTMYDEGMLADGYMIEILSSHTNVVFQPPVTHPRYSGINPYALGFAMFTDIKRICENPPTKTASGSPTSPAATGSRRSTTRCGTSRTRASSASTCRPS
jgi:stage V sporulation protein R